MTGRPVRRITGTLAVLRADDVDTDQILPARFLKGTGRHGLGRHLFADRDDAPASGAPVLLAGRNFGCGSSREHAVWALCDRGYRAVLARSFGDIFQANALKNGLVTVVVEAGSHRQLAASDGAEVTIDLESLLLTLPDATRTPFALPPFARRCLLEGLDELGFLLAQEPHIAAYEAAHSTRG